MIRLYNCLSCCSCLVLERSDLLCLVLRGYLIELNTTNPIQINPLNLTQSNPILWCFLFVWCNFYRFNLFWCKNICVLCKNQAERGWHHRNMTYNTNYTHKKTCITSCLVKVLYRSSPTPLITVRTPTSHFMS